MTRRTREEASVSLLIPSTDEVLSASLRTVVEEKLQEESCSFQSFPAGENTPGKGLDLSTPPPSSELRAVSSGVMSSAESFPSPRRHLVDPRLRRKMERLLSRVDGGSSRRAGVMKARAGPLSSSLVASILTKVDNDLRRQIAVA